MRSISVDEASDILRRCLEGEAFLDEVCAHSVQTKLRYITSNLKRKAFVYVDVIFSCDGEASDLREHLTPEHPTPRATFIAALVESIGANVSRAEVSELGMMTIEAEGHTVRLVPSVDDYEADEPLWELRVSDDGQFHTGGASLLCFVESGKVCFSVE